jgi:hypothetical protein
MIEWILDSSGWPCAKQVMTHPAVYLDHWAIRKIAGRPDLAVRFTSALKACQGTWAISLLNLMEFIKMTDETQAAQFEALLEQSMPNIFFLEFNALDVIERERQMLNGGSRNAPYGDVMLLDVFARMMPDTPRPFTAKNLVTIIVQRRDELLEGLARFNDTIIDKTQLMREQISADKQFDKAVRGSHEVAKHQRAWLFLRELVGRLLLDRKSPITANDAMDLFHAIVPVAYCDFVLLDAAWVERVKVARERLIQHNIEVTPAKAFSEKPHGLADLFECLENYRK